MAKEIWSQDDELEFKMGDMNGIAYEDVPKKVAPKNDKFIQDKKEKGVRREQRRETRQNSA